MLAAAVGSVLAGSASYAAITPQISGPINAGTAALVADPTLANYVSFDLQVNLTGGDKWASSDMRVTSLNGQKFYIPPGDGTDDNIVKPASTRNAAATAYYQNDNYVAAPVLNTTRVNVLGKSSRAPAAQPNVATFPSNGHNFFDGNDPNGTAFEPANDQMLIDISWGDLNVNSNTATGVQAIARITVSKNLSPNANLAVVVGNMKRAAAPSEDNFFTFTLAVPEPASVALMSLGLGAVALRRRK